MGSTNPTLSVVVTVLMLLTSSTTFFHCEFVSALKGDSSETMKILRSDLDYEDIDKIVSGAKLRPEKNSYPGVKSLTLCIRFNFKVRERIFVNISFHG